MDARPLPPVPSNLVPAAPATTDRAPTAPALHDYAPTASAPITPAPTAPGLTIAEALDLAQQAGATGIRSGIGRTAELWRWLEAVAAYDLGVARAIEPHLDALAILAEAAHPAAPGSWGVFAAEAPVATPLQARRQPTAAAADAAADTAAGDAGGSVAGEASNTKTGTNTPHGTDRDTRSAQYTLSGTKPWCSLADRLDNALVTATLPDGRRQLFAVSLKAPGVHPVPATWFARGLSEIPSGPVEFADVPATPVGDPGWYLERPGFWWGAIGVAACWHGGAVGVARALFDAARRTERPGDLLAMHLGAVDALLSDSRRALAEAAVLVDTGAATGEAGHVLALRVRATVARASEAVLAHVAHALGPSVLALDARHAKRVADLELYLRQQHAENDDAALGVLLATDEEAPW